MIATAVIPAIIQLAAKLESPQSEKPNQNQRSCGIHFLGTDDREP